MIYSHIDMKYLAYTDGSSRGNPGPAGWATIIMSNDNVKEYSGRSDLATNNQMELLGVLHALSFASSNLNKNNNDNDVLEIYSDSKYAVTGANEWIYNWVRNNWKTSTKKDVMNVNLWQKIWSELTVSKEKNILIKFIHIYGHSGHKFNDRADYLCTNAALKKEINIYKGRREDYEDWIIANSN